MKVFRKCTSIFLAGILTFSLTGCSSGNELGEVGIATGFFLDVSPVKNHYTLLCEVADFSGYEKSSNLSTKLIKAQGNTIEEVLQTLHARSEKELCFSHAKVMLLGDGFQTVPLKNTITHLLNQPDIKSDIALCMASEEILKQEKDSAQSVFEPLFQLIERTLPRKEWMLYTYCQKENFSLPIITKNENAYSVQQAAKFTHYQYQTSIFYTGNQL